MRILPTFTLILVLLTGHPVIASILGHNVVEIDLTDEEDTREKVTWSPDLINVTDEGLGWEGEHRSKRDFWMMTKPIGIGTSWRPTTNANVQVTLSPEASGYKLPNGQQSYENVGRVFVRYSPDRKHWSNWQAVGFSPEAQREAIEHAKTNTGFKPYRRSYSTSLAVPRMARERYSERVSKYMRSDVAWSSDEEALVRNLVAEDPDFFKQEQPFIGYVQILYEGSLSGGLRLKKLNIEIGWAVGGMQSIPKDPSVQENRDGPWRFVAE